MPLLHVERTGGLAGFGGAGAHIRSHGHIDTATLSHADQQAVEALFHQGGAAEASQVRDGFRYKISRTTPKGAETIEAPESLLPTALTQCVKDELV